MLAVVHIAKMISDHYGDKEKRTTNALPYPSDVSEDEAHIIKLQYAKKQFGATMMAVFPGTLTATFNFAPLYAIQAAPFMMTLVRKGKCDARHYHCVYAATLIYPVYLYHVIIRRGSTQLVDVVICCLYMLSFNLRICHLWSNEAMCSIVVPMVVISWTFLPNLDAAWALPGVLHDACGHAIWLVVVLREVISDSSVYMPFARSILKKPDEQEKETICSAIPRNGNGKGGVCRFGGSDSGLREGAHNGGDCGRRVVDLWVLRLGRRGCGDREHRLIPTDAGWEVEVRQGQVRWQWKVELTFSSKHAACDEKKERIREGKRKDRGT